MDRFAALRAFITVAEAGNFAAAARELGLSRSQVNRSVINLEDRLGVHLFNRTTRAVAMTPSGRAFYERVKSVLADLSEAEAAIQDDHEQAQGEMRINAPMSFGTLHLARALSAFMARHPRIRVQLSLTDRFVDPVAEGFDMTVRIGEVREQPSLIDHEIVEMRRVICVAPSFVEHHGAPTAVADLMSAPCLHYGNLPTGNSWRLIDTAGTPHDVRVNGVLCSNNAEVLREAAVAGLGIALLPTFIAGAELQSGRLISVLDEYRAPTIALSLLYPPNRHLSARTRLFVEFMHERFGGRPYWDLVA
jgi:DNA-binding transcriptional LysR family regulator